MGRFRKLSDDIYKLEHFVNEKNKKKLFDIYKKSKCYQSEEYFKSHSLNKKQKEWIIDYLKENLIKNKNKKDKNFTKIVTSILNPDRYRIILVSYHKSQSKNKRTTKKNLDMECHYDVWSDWNLMLSLGNESIFKRPGKKDIGIKSGDLVLFNGDKVKHGVVIKDGKGLGSTRRVTYQIRREIPEYFRKDKNKIKIDN